MFKPNRQFQAGIDKDGSRRRLRENTLSLRRQERASKLQQKRQRLINQSNQSNGSNPNSNSSNSNQSNDEIISLSELPKLRQGLFSEHPATQFECARKFRKLLAVPQKPPIRQVVECEVVPRFITFCRNQKCPELQLESLWVLTNITSSSSSPEFVANVIRNGAHSVFIELLGSPSYEIQTQSMWALGNIAGENTELRDLLLENKVLQAIYDAVKPTFDVQKVTKLQGLGFQDRHPLFQFIELLDCAAWAMGNLCRGRPTPSTQNVMGCVEILSVLLGHHQFLDGKIGKHMQCTHTMHLMQDLISSTFWAFSYLTGSDADQDALVQRLSQKGVIPKLIGMMDREQTGLRQAACRVIGNLLSGSDEVGAMCLELGVLDKYRNIFAMKRDRAVWSREDKEICWSLSNICAATTKKHRLCVLESGLFVNVIAVLRDSPYEAAKEAVHVVANVTEDGDRRIIGPLLKMGMMDALCAFLKKFGSALIRHSSTLMVAFECLESVLNCGQQNLCDGETNAYADLFEEAGGLDWIEDLQANDKVETDVYEKAVDIITTYFDPDDEMGYGVNGGDDDTQTGSENGPHETPDEWKMTQHVNDDGTFSFGNTETVGAYSF